MPSSQGEAIRERFPPASDVDRAAVLRYVAGAPLRYGEWKHLKALYKHAETAGEAEILGTLIGRLDAEPLSTSTVAPLTWPELQYPHQTRAAAVSGSTLYVATGPNRPGGGSGGDIHAIDLTNPVQPRLIGSANVRDAQALAAQGEFLYVAGRGLRIVDVSDSRRPRPIGALDMGNLPRIVSAGRYLYCLMEDSETRGGLLVVDLSDPT